MVPLTTSPDVTAALKAGHPVVALESTIITHGMPWPRNFETAQSVEEAVREADAVPATIAVMQGQIRVGLETEELEALARTPRARKLSRADLAHALVCGDVGATTVAATMICAKLAGIEVFATGGIGGAHRGAETSFDVSADLQELAQTEITVVCAGAKAILDIPKTIEVLETLGVPVITYQSDDFPAFWSRASGILSPMRADDVGEIAQSHRMRGRLGLPGGQLVANPVPAEDELEAHVLAPVIAQADAEARERNLSGKAVTPFLLGRILELTEGRSLQTNISLVRNNARLAARIARALADRPA